MTMNIYQNFNIELDRVQIECIGLRLIEEKSKMAYNDSKFHLERIEEQKFIEGSFPNRIKSEGIGSFRFNKFHLRNKFNTKCENEVQN